MASTDMSISRHAALLLFALACPTARAGDAATSAPAAAGAVVAAWSMPVASRAAQPQLVAGAGALHLSWIEPDGKAHRLRYARDTGSGFDAPREIARGARWFVNWADVPSFTVLSDGSLAAYFLQKSADAPYAYDVRLTRSEDGTQWSPPITVHDDGTTTEHGFASIWPWSDDEVAVAWLDGRHTAGGGHAGHGGDGGAMTLRGAVFGPDGKRQEWELDDRTCDCCQTDVAVAAAGPVLVYRDRADGEIRDISITRWREGAWTAPRRVHADDWFMPACPVNGPAVAARGSDVFVAWYTVAGGTPVLRVAHSRDDGVHFDAPRDLARGAEVLGRVDVAVDADALYVAWLSEDARTQSLWLARLPHAAQAADIPAPTRVAGLARGRGTGFPRLALRDGVAYLVWTDIRDKAPLLRGARVAFAP
jgi:hypothetical protein